MSSFVTAGGDIGNGELLAQNAQNTADSAAGGVANLNDPNLMNVIEKQYNIVQFSGLTSQYNVILQNAKDDGIDTTALTTAYNNLNQFMANVLVDPDHASDVNRAIYKKYQDDYNQELSNIQNALQNNVNNKFASAASAESQAISTASQAFSAAQSARDAGDAMASEFPPVSQAASSALASAMSAESTASSAVNQASSAAADSKDAKQIAGAVSQSYKTLTDGSTMTIAELQGGLAAKLTKTDLNGYATQDWSQNQIKMTADGINGAISSVKNTVDSHTTSINTLQTDSDGFKDQFTKVNNTISQHTTDIGTLQHDAQSLSSNFDSLNTDNGTNQHNISDLQQSAKEFSSTLETVQTQVQNSAVGTNLLTGTSRDLQTAPDSPSSSWGGNIHSISSDELSILASNQVTVRAFIHNPTTHTANLLIWTDGGNFGVGTDVPAGTDGYSTITAYSSPSSITRGDIDIRAYTENVAISGVQYKELKLEKGSLATDWCANPADNATVADVSSISQTINGIQTAVSKKVDNETYQAYVDQTAKDITSKVSTADFSTYKTQTANDINLSVKKGDLLDQINMQAGKTLISSSRQLTLSGNSVLIDSNDPVIMKSANIDTLLVGKTLTTADISANTFSTNNDTFVVDKYGAVTASNLTIKGVTNLVYNAALLGGSGSNIPGWSISNNGCYWPGNVHDGVPSIGWNGTTGAGAWTIFAQTKLHPLNGATGQPFSASVWFLDFGSDTSLLYQFALAFFDSNGNRIDGAYVGNNWSGTTGQGWIYITINNAVAPSNAVSVGLQYWSYNGHGNAEFSSPMLTQTAQATGYQPDVGNVISAGEINGSVINGAVINTPVLNLGDNGQITNSYSVNDSTDWFQPINGSGSLKIANGYIQSTANILYYNKLLNGIGGDKWGHWESSTQFVPAPDQAHPGTGNVAESTLTPAFLKLDIFNADQSLVKSRAYVDGTGLYINDGGTQAIVSMISGYELVSNGMAYLNTGIQMKQDASFTFGNLAMNGYHSISMLDGKTLYFTDSPHIGGNPIEINAKTFTKSSRLSIKHDITPLSTAESSRLLNAIDVEKFRYTNDSATYKYQYGGVIDDVNSLGSKQYSMPPELLNEDGTGINLDSLTGILIKRVQDQDKMIGKLSLRLTKLEMKR